MKRLLTLIALASAAVASFGATLTPIQLLNPAGSTSGQAIISTGPSTPPAWDNVSLSGLSGVLPIVNGGTGASAASTARVNLGLGTAATVNTGTSGSTIPLLNGANTWSAAQTFTGNISVSDSSPLVTFNATSGSTLGTFNFNAAGITSWQEQATTSSLAFARYNAGVFVDSPFILSNSTGAVTMMDGITNTPVSGSTGSFTTLAASGTVSLPATTSIVGVANGVAAAAGAIGEIQKASATAISLTTGTSISVCSLPLTAGDWLVWGNMITAPSGATTNAAAAGISTTTGALPPVPLYGQVGSAGVGLPSGPPVPMRDIQLTSSSTVFLVANAQFTGGTMTASCLIEAQRYH